MSGETQGLTAPLKEPRRVPIRTLRLGIVGPDGTTPELKKEGEVLTIGTAQGNDLVLEDRTVSRYHLELRASAKGVSVKDLGSTNGTFVGDVRVESAVVPANTVLRLGRTRVRVSLGLEGQAPVSELGGKYGLVGSSEGLERLVAKLERVGPTNVGVLLSGESGTGKELVAKALHELSVDPVGPFVTVDCGAISPNLIASELFGHERGAFTGATSQRKGAFERANGGVLFLDEVGELPSSLQPQLLGVLERGSFQRVGGSQEISVKVRVVSATHRDLRREVNEGTFRLDLYYRVAQIVLELPALRDRKEDIVELVTHFLRECGHEGAIGSVISEATLLELQGYRWPGNIRELRNWVEATVALGEVGELPEHPDTKDAAQQDSELWSDSLLSSPYKEARALLLEGFEKKYLRRLLDSAGGNVSAAAREARMDRTYLIKLLSRHGLK